MTIKQSKTSDLQWKPIYFLANRDKMDRIKQANALKWDLFVNTCLLSGERFGGQFGSALDFPALAKVTNNYAAALLEGKLKSMNRWIACKQVSRIVYCLVRSQRFELSKLTKEDFVLGLSKSLSMERSNPKADLAKFLAPTVWIKSDRNLQTPRLDLIEVQKFREKCQNDLRVARGIILDAEEF